MTDWILLGIYVAMSVITVAVATYKLKSIMLGLLCGTILLAVLANTTAMICGKQCF